MEPVFEFRGYTDLSDCRNVIDAELALGATLEDVFDVIDSEQGEFVTELAGQISGHAVEISIYCTERGKVRRVFYLAETRDPEQTAPAYLQLAGELQSLYGTPVETLEPDSRNLQFICPESAPILLEEYRLSDTEHELYLSVVPSAANCGAAAGD
jgi:hypothetical protein